MLVRKAHCHVDAGPDRKEVMPREVVEACLRFLEQTSIPTLDITGGAPEMHPDFREIVQRARALGRHVIDRCNLTITRLPNYAFVPEFLAEHGVEITASLPGYTLKLTDAQRTFGGMPGGRETAVSMRYRSCCYGPPPRLGEVKTRLAASLGSAATFQLYRAFLMDLARRFALESDDTLHWAYTPMEDDFANELAHLVPGLCIGVCFPQRGFGLASRLYHVFCETSTRAFAKTMVIGSDVPQVSSALISQARLALDEHDAVWDQPKMAATP